VSTQAKSFLTPEQYLEIERKAEYKSEYYQGEMFAMAGASAAHCQLSSNVMISLGNQVRGRPCRVLGSDMRIHIPAAGLFTYADVVALCGEWKFLDRGVPDTLVNPILIIEVLSLSTEAYDRGRKFEHYQSIESLRQYLLISSDRVRAELYTRQPDNLWLLAPYGRLEDSMDLESIGCRILLSELYENVDFSQ